MSSSSSSSDSSFLASAAGAASAGCSSCRGSSGEGGWVSKEGLQGFRFLEGNLCGCRNGQEVLHSVDHTVRHRCDSGVGDGEGEGGHVGNTPMELGNQVLVSDVKDLRIEDRARVINLLNDQSVGEGADLEHIEEGGLAHTHFISS